MSDSIEHSTHGDLASRTAAAELEPTPLTAKLLPSAPSLVEYRGARTTETFSNPEEEVSAMLGSAGVYDLGCQSFVRCTGRDRVRWLNGMVTNSVKGLEENTGCYAFVLNAQGQIQGDLNIYRLSGQPEALWLQTDRAQWDALTAFVRRYIIMDQVALEPENSWTAVGCAGPDAEKILSSLGISAGEISPVRLLETSWQGNPIVVVAAYSPGVPRYEIWIDSKAVFNLWNVLVAAGATPCGCKAVERMRIFEGIPAYGTDIGSRDLPQETNQMRALNFTKGCYLGQEIVERIRSRGNVHRTISGFVLERSGPAAGSGLIADGKSVGELTSVTSITVPGLGDQVVALGHIRREALESKQIVTAEGVAAAVHTLPLDFPGSAIRH